MKKLNTVAGGIALGIIPLVILTLGYGWVVNIIHLAHTTDPILVPVNVLRIIGIFVAPLGSVMGWVF